MDNIEKQQLIDEIKKTFHITYDIKNKYFKDMNFIKIRDWLEANGIDRHITIDMKSAGVIFVVKNNYNDKILLQIRATEVNPRIGVFGGGIENSESPEDTIKRELKEEMNFCVSKNELKFLEVVEHDLKYKNGDKAHYQASVYTLELKEFPTIKLDDESNGIIAISKENYNNFINIENPKYLQIEKFWEKTIEKILKI